MYGLGKSINTIKRLLIFLELTLLSLAPWDFLCQLRLCRAFENQIRRLDDPKVKHDFGNLPGEKCEPLLTRIIKLCHFDCGPDLIDFVVYRPDLIYSSCQKSICSELNGPDQLKLIRKLVQSQVLRCSPRHRCVTSVSSLCVIHILLLTKKLL